MRPAEASGSSSRSGVDALQPPVETVLLAATEAAALAAGRLLGRGDAGRVKEAAASAMLQSLEELMEIPARVALSPSGDEILSPGSMVGRGVIPQLELAVYPVEASGLVARGLRNAVSVIVAAPVGSFPTLPPVAYVEKLVVGPAARGGIALDDSLADNLRRLAFARDCRVPDLVVALLDRPRHQDRMDEIRSTGARVLLLEDGDVAAAMATGVDGTGVDAMLGVGGIQETLIAACAMRCLGGDIQARLWPRNDEESMMAGSDAGRVYKADELSPPEVVAAVTGISGGPLLLPVRYRGAWTETDSLVMSSRYSTVRHVTTRHQKPLVD